MSYDLSPIASFARIKPLEADKAGGADSSKRISRWDEIAGTVEMTGVGGPGPGGAKTFEHMAATLPPEATQAHVYDVIAAPLVARWLGGVDVDLISYGQTGSGKTFTMFGPPHSMAHAAAALGGGGGTISGEGILRDEHGFILRSGFDALAAVAASNARGAPALLHGSMVEISILSFADQTACDLLNKRTPCYVDDDHHLQGALQVPLRTAADVVRLAAAVETRLTRGTRMNDTSSRSHCVTVLTLTVLQGGAVRESRLQFFDLMGSERFTGANAAHDPSKSSKATMGGWEGIFANLSLSALMGAVDSAATVRRSKGKAKPDRSMVGFLLTKLMMGSLVGSALTGMITCLSQAPRNGEETYLSLKYGAGMAKLLNAPAPQPAVEAAAALASARRRHAASSAKAAGGVQGKYQARREAEVAQWSHVIRVLEELTSG